MLSTGLHFASESTQTRFRNDIVEFELKSRSNTAAYKAARVPRGPHRGQNKSWSKSYVKLARHDGQAACRIDAGSRRDLKPSSIWCSVSQV